MTRRNELAAASGLHADGARVRQLPGACRGNPGKLYAQSAPQAPEAEKPRLLRRRRARRRGPARQVIPDLRRLHRRPRRRRRRGGPRHEIQRCSAAAGHHLSAARKTAATGHAIARGAVAPVTHYPPRPNRRRNDRQSAPVAQPTPASHALRGRKAHYGDGAQCPPATVANAMRRHAVGQPVKPRLARPGRSAFIRTAPRLRPRSTRRSVNIPQSLSVVTKEFIADNAFQNITDVTRYVPGVAVHQGEGNRDELIIRGVELERELFRQRLPR